MERGAFSENGGTLAKDAFQGERLEKPCGGIVAGIV